MRALRFTFVLPLFLLSLFPAGASAAWPHDPSIGTLPISTAAGDQWWASSVADGAGGVFLAWHGTIGNDIYVQRVDAKGTRRCSSPWTASSPASSPLLIL